MGEADSGIEIQKPPEQLFKEFMERLARVSPGNNDIIAASLGPDIVLDQKRGDLFLEKFSDISQVATGDISLYSGLLYFMQDGGAHYQWAIDNHQDPFLAASIGNNLHAPELRAGTALALEAGALEKGWWEINKTPIIFRDYQDQLAACIEHHWRPAKTLIDSLSDDEEITERLIDKGVDPYRPDFDFFIYRIKYMDSTDEDVIERAKYPPESPKQRPLTADEKEVFDTARLKLLDVCAQNNLYHEVFSPNGHEPSSVKKFGAELFIAVAETLEPDLAFYEREGKYCAVLVPDTREAEVMKSKIRVRSDNENRYTGSHNPGSLGWIDFMDIENGQLPVWEIQSNIPIYRLHHPERYEDWSQLILMSLGEYAVENGARAIAIPIPTEILDRWKDKPNRTGTIETYAYLPKKLGYELTCRSGRMFWEKELPTVSS